MRWQRDGNQPDPPRSSGTPQTTDNEHRGYEWRLIVSLAGTLAALVNTLPAASFFPVSDGFVEEGWARLKLSTSNSTDNDIKLPDRISPVLLAILRT